MNFARVAATVMLWVAALVHLGSFAARVSMHGVANVELKTNRSDQGLLVTGDREYLNRIRAFYASSGPVVPFHNIDHAENIMQFADWYATQMSFSTEDKGILKLSAISHDVMHPGRRCPQNTPADVRGENIPDDVQGPGMLTSVKRSFLYTESYELVDFAAEVWEELQKGKVREEQMLKAFGHTWVPFNATRDGSFIPELMVDRAPQEVLHAWVTNSFLKELTRIGPNSKAKVLINILMTSISLQFKLKFAKTANAERDHVSAMCQDEFFRTFQCGLLLHLLDMGWCTQQQCAKEGVCTTPNPSLVFAPRFLAESGFYREARGRLVETTFDLTQSEGAFVAMVKDLVMNIRTGAADDAIMDETMAKVLLSGADQHIRIVGTSSFTDAIRDIITVYKLDEAEWMVD